MKQNPFVVIEGGDGAGKGTQTDLLVSALQAAGNKVTKLDFPQYTESLGGKLCGEALKGVHGDFRHMSPYLASLPFTIDRLEAKALIEKALTESVVICNRYTPSNIAYQSAKILADKLTFGEGNSPEKSCADFITFLEALEYGKLGLPRPTLVIYLYVPFEVSYALVAEKAQREYLGGEQGKRDQHEADLQFQRIVVETYLRLAKERQDWVTIDCSRDGEIISREEIHAKVLAAVTKHQQ